MTQAGEPGRCTRETLPSNLNSVPGRAAIRVWSRRGRGASGHKRQGHGWKRRSGGEALTPRRCVPHCYGPSGSGRAGYKAVRFSCDELINSIGLSGLHPTRDNPRPSPPRAGRPMTGVRLKGSQANAPAGGASNARPGRARPR